MSAPQNAYMLSHREGDEEEDYRLDSQHYVVKESILGGHLIHPIVPSAKTWTAVADLGCGTGVWLNDVARTHFHDGTSKRRPELIGFDVTSSRFASKLEDGVELIEHDCTQPFDPQYHGKFDLVNIRVVVFAIPEKGLQQTIGHALKLLKPGGYLQWGDSEPSQWKSSPHTPAIEKAISIVSQERKPRSLVTYMPHFMLTSILEAQTAIQPHQAQIQRFELFPGGVIEGRDSKAPKMDQALSDTTLEAIKQLLKACVARLQSSDAAASEISEVETIQSEMANIIASSSAKVGGFFPFVVAQKVIKRSS